MDVGRVGGLGGNRVLIPVSLWNSMSMSEYEYDRNMDERFDSQRFFPVILPG